MPISPVSAVNQNVYIPPLGLYANSPISSLLPLSSLSPSEMVLPKERKPLNEYVVVILLIKNYDELNREELLDTSRDFDKNLNDLKKQNAEKRKELNLLAQRTVDATTWGALKEVSSYFSNAVFLVGGLTACSSPFTAIVLTASGAAGVVGKIAKVTNTWQYAASFVTSDTESQNSFASTMDKIFSWGSSIGSLVAVAGGSWFYGETFASASLDVVKNSAYFASSLSSAATSYKSGISSSKVADSERVLYDLQIVNSTYRSSIEQGTSNAQSLADTTEGVVAKGQNILATLRKVCKSINQK